MRARLIVAGALAGAVPIAWGVWALTRPDGRAPVPGRLVTNEYAHWNPDADDARRSRTWDVTSGSLFTRDGLLWTGPPDTETPDATSSNGTGSSVFRMHTHRTDYLDTHVTLDVRNVRLLPDGAQDYDGVHVMLRHKDETELYVASLNRRDGLLVIKKKLTGGSENEGRYFTLAQVRHSYAFGKWQRFEVRVSGTSPVVITVAQSGRELLRAVDDGRRHDRPITRAGSVGVRGDRCEFEFKIRIRNR
ncbi:hypothetical protein BJF79_36535 [Actinomadura sp. CNU-125]|uniref:hypothetical protein n=1 Tax=Actinomadura sp. CNU-125 TaxID=1904961 RepID=UPI000968A6FA|nr:hypothetical protein [Actinomadura sp. CNU-125]OLT32009.1 hypothetical protein BJF79_36535 [Actinomadura sp. CNU-125]